MEWASASRSYPCSAAASQSRPPPSCLRYCRHIQRRGIRSIWNDADARSSCCPCTCLHCTCQWVNAHVYTHALRRTRPVAPCCSVQMHTCPRACPGTLTRTPMHVLAQVNYLLVAVLCLWALGNTIYILPQRCRVGRQRPWPCVYAAVGRGPSLMGGP